MIEFTNACAAAFYFERIYTKVEAEKAKNAATKVINFVSELFKTLNPNEDSN